jgi:hypothetical protein
MDTSASLRGGTVALVVALVAGFGAHAGGYSFTTVAPPPGTPAGDFVEALSINDGGQILVSALSPNVNPITGLSYVDVDDIYDSRSHVFTPIPDYPGSVPGTTVANGINDSGQVVGQYEPAVPYLQAFSYAGGAFATLPTGGTNYNFAIAISNSGIITGDDGTPTTGLGFIYAGGAYTYFSAGDPATYFTTGEGVNDAGTVVGVAGLLSGGGEFGFTYSGGAITPFSAPGYAAAFPISVNDAGVIVGYASNDGFATYTGFVDSGGVFTFVDAPGSSQTGFGALNDQGDIVGEYYDANGNEFAFLATPVPEPATWAFMLIGITGVGLAARRRPSSRRLTDRSEGEDKSPNWSRCGTSCPRTLNQECPRPRG